MPFVYDFSSAISDVYTVDVEPKGWKGKVTVEYVIAQAHKYDTVLSVVWRVKGTTHCFTIGEKHLNLISNGDYKKHFTEALQNFREDYLSWFEDDEYKDAEWREEYRRQYGRFIIERKQDNGSEDKKVQNQGKR